MPLPSGGSSLNCVNCVNSVHGSDKFRSAPMFQYSSTRLSCNTSEVVCVDLTTSMFRSRIGNDSSFDMRRRAELEVRRDDDQCNFPSTPNRHGLLCHPSFRPLADPCPNFLEDHHRVFVSHGLIPYQGGFSDPMISSRQFNCFICDWEHEVFTIFRRSECLCFEFCDHGLLPRPTFPAPQ